LWIELIVVVWLCWVYDLVSNLAPVREHLALAHAASLWRLETRLHMDPEASLDHWLASHHSFAVVVSNYYDNAHFVVTLTLLGWIWWRAPMIYRPLRNNLVLINVIGMIVFFVYPTAPPRLLDPARFSDVVASTHAFGSWHSGTLADVANQFAAMPSLHVAWAMWSALAAWRLWSDHRVRILVWIYPAVTAVAVMATGNHYLADVVAGVATFVVATLAADSWQGWWTAREARRALESSTSPPGEVPTSRAADLGER
jgi:PAP2 superfamily